MRFNGHKSGVNKYPDSGYHDMATHGKRVESFSSGIIKLKLSFNYVIHAVHKLQPKLSKLSLISI